MAYRPDPLALAVGALAAYRLTILVTADGITADWRERVQKRLVNGGDEKLADALECAWCVGAWVAAPATVLTLLGQRNRWWWAGAGALASSAVTGIIASYASPNA